MSGNDKRQVNSRCFTYDSLLSVTKWKINKSFCDFKCFVFNLHFIIHLTVNEGNKFQWFRLTQCLHGVGNIAWIKFDPVKHVYCICYELEQNLAKIRCSTCRSKIIPNLKKKIQYVNAIDLPKFSPNTYIVFIDDIIVWNANQERASLSLTFGLSGIKFKLIVKKIDQIIILSIVLIDVSVTLTPFSSFSCIYLETSYNLRTCNLVCRLFRSPIVWLLVIFALLYVG